MQPPVDIPRRQPIYIIPQERLSSQLTPNNGKLPFKISHHSHLAGGFCVNCSSSSPIKQTDFYASPSISTDFLYRDWEAAPDPVSILTHQSASQAFCAVCLNLDPVRWGTDECLACGSLSCPLWKTRKIAGDCFIHLLVSSPTSNGSHIYRLVSLQRPPAFLGRVTRVLSERSRRQSYLQGQVRACKLF